MNAATGPWMTGTPTEDDYYLVMVNDRMGPYLDQWRNKRWELWGENVARFARILPDEKKPEKPAGVWRNCASDAPKATGTYLCRFKGSEYPFTCTLARVGAWDGTSENYEWLDESPPAAPELVPPASDDPACSCGFTPVSECIKHGDAGTVTPAPATDPIKINVFDYYSIGNLETIVGVIIPK